MKTHWLITPHFFETDEPALLALAAETDAVNGPHVIADRSPESLARLHGPIRDFVVKTVQAGGTPISVAGDCCAALPVAAGLQAAGQRPHLVWLDAHGDFNTPETSPSQFLGGMPLAMITGRGPQDLAHRVGLTPLEDEQVWLVDGRDLDPGERSLLEASGVHHIAVSAFARLVLDGPVHLHLDVDIIDAEDAPAMKYPVGGGPSLSEVRDACADFAAANAISAISVSGWSGALDTNGRTREASRTVLDALTRSLET